MTGCLHNRSIFWQSAPSRSASGDPGQDVYSSGGSQDSAPFSLHYIVLRPEVGNHKPPAKFRILVQESRDRNREEMGSLERKRFAETSTTAAPLFRAWVR